MSTQYEVRANMKPQTRNKKQQILYLPFDLVEEMSKRCDIERIPLSLLAEEGIRMYLAKTPQETVIDRINR